jgi:hypothetical protein
MDELIGVESSNPLKKDSILILAPKIAANTRLFQSFFSIFSALIKREEIQNNSAAPPVLRNIKPKAPT